MRRQLLTALRATIVLTVLLGFLYPAAVWAVGRAAFGHAADGSLVAKNGAVVGSALIGQRFADNSGAPLAQYFQPRPSAAGAGYDATASGASNLGPSNPTLLDAVAARARDYRSFNGLMPGARVPVDAVTASGSGLDPDISVANALDQAARVARARRMTVADVQALVRARTRNRAWGFLGEKTVNVVDLNLALDARAPSG